MYGKLKYAGIITLIQGRESNITVRLSKLSLLKLRKSKKSNQPKKIKA